MKPLKIVCFTISLLCVVVAAIMGISMVWSKDTTGDRWRWLVTTLIVFLASSATLSLAKVMDRRT